VGKTNPQGKRNCRSYIYLMVRSMVAFYSICLPSANGIELIELGGMTPTSVTTAVMLVEGVKSYSGFNI
jgi:hypothetical protein